MVSVFSPKGDFFNLGEEGGVAAVVGPVGVEEFDLGERGSRFSSSRK